jgi:hypothetical protein
MRKQKKVYKNFNKYFIVPFSVFIVFVLLVFGCGKKAPPIPPREAKPLTGNNVCASVDRPTHKITWTFHREKGMTMPHLSCFIVYRVKMFHSDSNFKNSPALFTCIADILIKISAYEYKKSYNYMP